MDNHKRQEVIDTIVKGIRNKMKRYSPESTFMPFHTRLLGKDRMALFSFMHSLNTTFGTTIYEPVAITLANESFIEKIKQRSPGGIISSKAQVAIQEIMDDLTSGREISNKDMELEKIRSVCRDGELRKVKLTKIDIYLKSIDTVYMFDLKSPKPNIGEFKGFKRTLLEWAATEFYLNPSLNIVSGLAIPYNPYEPKPYERWTMQGLFDIPKEIYVGRELWDFLAGKEVYEDLLCCFEDAGIILRKEIDDYFSIIK